MQLKKAVYSFNTVQHDSSAMLTDAFQDSDNCIPIRYHFDGKLFNLRSLQANSMCSGSR